MKKKLVCTMSRGWMWFAPVFLLGMLSMVYVQAKNDDGEALYEEKGCNACHGNDATSPLMLAYPKLAGQNKDYLIEQVKDIRDEKRTNGQAGIMKATITGITDDEISEIATWLSEL
ncbi:MAG: Cytochrome C [uncultured Thiotrichaceae bacterium]|uniref:Cytochrome C n=1 Tax=uncultured Thiotrichaceae bacterium TaxID=298394 RepID=A0A6S6SWE2_9GAMM|nr:MAG: Cytochrome C [uncultured Thiotrichaceae bacterium]